MIIKPISTTVKNRIGWDVSMKQALVLPTKRPAGGWKVTVTVNGTSVVIGGNSPAQVARYYALLLKDNNISVTDGEVWATLNMFWIPRTAKRNRLVPMDNFLDCVERVDDSPEFTGKVVTATWLSAYLDILGFYLSVDENTFDYAQVDHYLKIMDSMLSPSSSHRLGDLKVYTSYLSQYSKFSHTPFYNLTEAKDWFIGFQNTMADAADLPALTKDSATLKYTWLNGTKN